MVPIETLTSMLLLPSSGSDSSMYSPCGQRLGTTWIAPIFSLAIAARWPPHSLASISTSLLMTSSFFCS